MEITPTPEKPKRKNGALPARGNPDLAFGMMFAASLVMVLFQLDNLIGAVPLQALYDESSIVFAIFSVLALLWLWLNWGIIPIYAGLAGVMLLIFAIVSKLGAIIAMLVGFLAAIPLIFLAPIVPITTIVIIVVVLLQWKFARTSNEFNKGLLVYTISFLIVATAYVWGKGVKNLGLEYMDDVYFQGEYYYLQNQFDWAGGGRNIVILYECNSLAFDCEEVYISPEDYYQERKTSIYLQPNDSANTVSIIVDGIILHTYHIKN